MAKTYEAEVKGIGVIHRVAKPFDEALRTLREAGASPITARDLAYARTQEGKNSSLCTDGSYIKEGVLYVPDESLFIRNSPLLKQKLAQEARKAHRNSNEFYVGDKLVKKYQEQAEADKKKEPAKRRVLTLQKRGKFEIPTNRFKDEELTLWLFRDQAENYGKFLRNANINEMPVCLTGNSLKNFANQLWFGRLVCRSGLLGDYRYFDSIDRMRGVLNAPKAPQKVLQPNLREIAKYSRRFVPEAVRGEFEKGLKALLER